MRRRRRLALGMLLTVSTILLSGCFKRSSTPTSKGTVNVSDDGTTVNVSTRDGSATYSGSASLPAGFPSEVPTPSVGTITGSYAGSDRGSAGYNVTYTLSANDAATAGSRYQAQLTAAGFSIEGTASTAAGDSKLDVFTAKGSAYQVGVTVTHAADGTATMNLAVSTTIE